MDSGFIISAFKKNQFPFPDRPEIAFSGKSNVGKSSLINVLVNRKKLAKTSSRPGRTQSINFFYAGKDLYFVDLPGYGFARVPLAIKKTWKKMVETYLGQRVNLAAMVLILDIRRDLSSGDKELADWLIYYGIEIIPVLTKADKFSRQKAKQRVSIIMNQFDKSFPYSPIVFSAKTKQGKTELWERIENIISESESNQSPGV